MIQANELRIGNLITDPDFPNIPSTVIEIQSDGFIVTNYNDGLVNVDADPIKLTEEILIKCGYSEKDLETGKILVIGESFDNVIGYTIRSLSPNIVIKTVHQLQNLYYALTSKELECSI
jgi:hypothetical protein